MLSFHACAASLLPVLTSVGYIVYSACWKSVSLCLFLPELWNDEVSGRKKRRDALSPDKKRRRPSVVSDILPLLIYLLLFMNPKYQYLDVSLFYHLNAFMFPVALSLTSLTSIYCLYAAWLGHPGRLDSYQKGVQTCLWLIGVMFWHCFHHEAWYQTEPLHSVLFSSFLSCFSDWPVVTARVVLFGANLGFSVTSLLTANLYACCLPGRGHAGSPQREVRVRGLCVSIQARQEPIHSQLLRITPIRTTKTHTRKQYCIRHTHTAEHFSDSSHCTPRLRATPVGKLSRVPAGAHNKESQVWFPLKDKQEELFILTSYQYFQIKLGHWFFFFLLLLLLQSWFLRGEFRGFPSNRLLKQV